MINQILQAGQSVYNKDKGLGSAEDTAFNNLISTMSAPQAPPTMGTVGLPKMNPVVGILAALADAFSKKDGGQGVISPFLQGRQMVVEQENQRKMQEWQIEKMKQENAERIATIQYNRAKDQRQEWKGDLQDFNARQEKLATAAEKQKYSEYDKMWRGLQSANTEADYRFFNLDRYNDLASEFGGKQITEQEIKDVIRSKFGTQAAQDWLSKQVMPVVRAYGYVPKNLEKSINASRERLKSQYGFSDDDIGTIPTETTLRAQEVALRKEMQDLKMKYLPKELSDKSKKADGDLALQRVRLSQAQQNLQHAKEIDPLRVAKAQKDLDKASADYKHANDAVYASDASLLKKVRADLAAKTAKLIASERSDWKGVKTQDGELAQEVTNLRNAEAEILRRNPSLAQTPAQPTGKYKRDSSGVIIRN